MGSINVRQAKFGEVVTVEGVHLIADEGDSIFTAVGDDPDKAFVVLLPPEHAIMLGKALVKCGRTGARAKAGIEHL